MSSKSIKIPGPDHPITISPARTRIIVTVAGRHIADSLEALALKEASYPAVYYIPRVDVDMSQLQRTSHQTYCPYKGDCAYYSIPVGGERSVNAVWTYEAPYPAVSVIRDYLAFYPDRVDSIEVIQRESTEVSSVNRDVGVAGSNPVIPTNDSIEVFPAPTLKGSTFWGHWIGRALAGCTGLCILMRIYIYVEVRNDHCPCVQVRQ
jgi:uncharacterized protein (DUF427 family)